jgi:serine/threonine-protein kinase OSR1/STK39
MSETTAAAMASAIAEVNNTNDDDDNNNTCVEWATDPSQYEWIGKIGQGAFASVWRACTTVAIGNINSNTNTASSETANALLPSVVEERKMIKKECAIKVLNLDHVDSNLSEIRLEVQAMRLSSHPNVLSCFAAFVKSTDLWLVTQLMRKGSSLHCLQNARRTARLQQKNNTTSAETSTIPILMEKHILYIMHETLLGLQYIHEHNGQIHRDIKAGNILIDHNGDIRIADFGVSGWLINAGKQQEKAKTFVGTPCWMVSQVLVTQYHHNKVLYYRTQEFVFCRFYVMLCY